MMNLNKITFLFLIFISFTINANSKTPLFVNDIKWPPFFFPNLEKPDLGLGKEVINHCINQSSFELHYKTLPIKRTHLYMKSGELDISVYSYKEDRESFVYYSKEVIFYSNYGFASKKGDNVQIDQLEDVKNYHFGHLAGLAHTEELTEIIQQKKQLNQVSIGHDIDSMFGQLLASPQRFQVMANSLETFSWRAKQLNILDKITLHDFVIKQKAYFVTVSKTSKNIKDPHAFLAEMDNCINDLKTSGKYQDIARKYGL